MADKADQYWVGLYHHLEALRQLNRSKLLDALRSTKSVSLENETWYRLIDYQYSNNWLVNSPKELKDSLLASNWRAFPVQFEIPANSQIFAQLLIAVGYEGVIYPSTKGNGNCAALFPQNFAGPGSHVSLSDPAPQTLKYRVLDMDTFDALTES